MFVCLSGNPTFVQKLTSGAPTGSEHYGTSVSVSDGRLAIGAPASSTAVSYLFVCMFFATTHLAQYDIKTKFLFFTFVLEQVGSVYIYYLDSANFWVFSEQILPTVFPPGAGGSGEGILFGHSVGVSLNALAVGAPENNIAADNSGSVFIYDVIETGCDSVSALNKSSSSRNEQPTTTTTEQPSYLPTSPYPTYVPTESR